MFEQIYKNILFNKSQNFSYFSFVPIFLYITKLKKQLIAKRN